MTSQNENEVVNDLVEAITDELRAEPVAVQVKVAFAVLAHVLTSAANDDPQGMKRAALELQQLMQMAQ